MSRPGAEITRCRMMSICDQCGEEFDIEDAHECPNCGITLCGECICEECDDAELPGVDQQYFPGGID